ncbi:putative hydroxypyruvate isomerase isoform X4 [Thalassophryne amazonica]|uniref:putative hydroxypyruvate isomerase isoform X4 n=1 Tax=Thalassophryne amazonica TaxID=390379 RepID=UPI001470C408|nr:putative hydroxypyruvate isomerase isoform X4 [Thalassophryne amazonica]
MSRLRFCANISWLFTELPELSQRIHSAASAGFRAVEVAWPYDSDLDELQRAQQATGVEVVLINTPLGDVKAGDLGLAAVPGREAEFRRGLDLALKYAKALDCRRIHLMAGRLPAGSHRAAVAKEMEAIFVQNLQYSADVLLQEGITGLIEPINTRITDPTYFLDSPHQGHIQIAQVPGRNEPDSAGELNYRYLFNLLETLGYQGYIGCEYKPLRSTNEGLGWLKDHWTLSQ